MQVQDIKTVLELAKQGQLGDERLDDREESERQGKAIEAVETWLIEIGALPSR